MLKKIRVLFLGLVVLAGSACVTPTHASSADSVIITYIQAAGASGAKDEAIILHNNGSVAVDITGWCLSNKSNILFACFNDDHNGDPAVFTLPGNAYATIASEQYLQEYGYGSAYSTLSYTVTNQSSGSIVTSADTISLVDSNGEIIDWHGWTTGLPSGKGWTRLKLFSLPDIYATTGGSSDWGVNAWMSLPIDTVITSMPIEPEPDPSEGENGGEIMQSNVRFLMVSEILANPVGSDAGNEFIELYNPTNEAIQTNDTLRFQIGLENSKSYAIPAGISIPALGYVTFYGSDLGFTLVNTNGQVRLYDGEAMIGESIAYTSPKEGQSWAFIDGTWEYTDELTPSSNNKKSLVEASDTDAAAMQKPCAANQYRNPETGRCRLIATEVNSLAPCKIGQVRNVETNRCRTLTSAVSSPSACKEGQERNLETNRCRNVKAMSTAEFGVKGIQQKAGAQLQWYYIVAIAGIVLLLIGYGVWEWRHELLKVWRRVRRVFVKRPS